MQSKPRKNKNKSFVFKDRNFQILSSKLFGFNNNSSRKNMFNFGWRFVFLILSVFYLLGINPLAFLINTIDAFAGDTERIKIYAQSSSPDKENERYGVGWWNEKNATKKPNLASDKSLISFSDTNSTFYSGGDYSLLIGNFNIPDILTNIPDEKINELPPSINTEINIINIENPVSESSENLTENQHEAEKNVDSGILNIDENITEQEEASSAVDEKNKETDDGGTVEIEELNADSKVEVETENSIDEVEIINQEISKKEKGFFDKIVSLYKNNKTQNVNAQDKLKIPSLDDLGKFNSAKLYFSLAATELKTKKEVDYGDVENLMLENEKIINNLQEDEASLEEDALGVDEDLAPKSNYEETDSSTLKEDISDIENLEENILEEEAEEPILQNEDLDEGLSMLEKINYLFAKKANAQNNRKEERVIIWYGIKDAGLDQDQAIENIVWHKLDTVYSEDISNALNGGYFEYEAPFLENWSSIENLIIRLQGVTKEEKDFLFYLDSVWVEADYKKDPDAPDLINESGEEWGDILELLSRQTTFRIDEEGEFKFKYRKNKRDLLDNIGETLGISSYWKNVNIRVDIEDDFGNRQDLPITIMFNEDGEFTIKLPEMPRSFRPGKYKIKFYIEDNSADQEKIYELSSNFNWGVLAINTNKSIYVPEDNESYIQMAVLDEKGHTICDADLTLEIINPRGEINILTTNQDITGDASSTPEIIRNPECGPDNVIDTPDYFAYFDLSGIGIYNMKLIANTLNGEKEISDSFEVREAAAFDIERIGPTRIYPMADYMMNMKIKANEDYSGGIREYLPEDFVIVRQFIKIKTSSSSEFVNYNSQVSTSSDISKFGEETMNGEKEIFWKNLIIKAGDELMIGYEFDAPNISPELYMLGPLEVGDFSETRQWQIASDVPVTSSANGGINTGWTSPANAWTPPQDNQYASRSIPSKSVPDYMNYLEVNSHTATDLGGIINTVEIGVEGYVANASVNTYLVPKFGSVYGATSSALALGATDDGSINWYNITADAAGPGTGNWTWANVINLDFKFFALNTGNSNRSAFVDQFYVRVDYSPNNKPTGTFVSAAQKPGSGTADITILVDDIDDNQCKAKVEYEAGTSCVFSPSTKIYIDETDTTATSTWNDAKIDNNLDYQIGSSTGWITTIDGPNNVYFDWLSKNNIDGAEGIYCLRLTVNDGQVNQATSATTTIYVDNKAPTSPGTLSLATSSKNSVILNFGATSTETNFKEYIVYWKPYDGTDPTETSNVHASTTDANLLNILFNNKATTTIGGLNENMQYSFSIWAYDDYGNVSSSSRVDITTNKAPESRFNSAASRKDGSGIVDIEVDIGDFNNHESIARVDYVLGADCNFSPPLDPSLDESGSNISSTFGAVTINNADVYQINDILTPATNTVAFDWDSRLNENTADDTYCLRLTVNDGRDDQNIPATTTLILDNKNPTDPGALSNGGVTSDSITLNFGAASTETNFAEYIIYYKANTSGVTESDNKHSSTTDINLANKLFNGKSTTTISGLAVNTDYYFKIWAYDSYGNKASSTEVLIRTNGSISNTSLTFTNPSSGNIAIADNTTEWNFQAVVNEEGGWTAIDNSVLRLANSIDNASPFNDLEFTWDQETNTFTETGADIQGMASISGSSNSSCAGNSCTLDFKIIFDKKFATTAVDYAAELYSVNDSAANDQDSYVDFYKINMVRVRQIHYRWRNDDGGE